MEIKLKTVKSLFNPIPLSFFPFVKPNLFLKKKIGVLCVCWNKKKEVCLCVPVDSVASCDSSTLTVFVTVFTSRYGECMCMSVYVCVNVYEISNEVQKFYVCVYVRVHVVCHIGYVIRNYVFWRVRSSKFQGVKKKFSDIE